MFAELPLLSLTIWLPIVGGVLVLASGDRAANATRWTALTVAILTFIVSLPLYSSFDPATAQMQFVERVSWIPAFNVEYYLGVDGISMPLILLTTFVSILVIIAGWEVIQYRPSQYMAAFLIMEGVMVGVFAALDAMLFYVFWEAMLIPMFLIIGVWGGPNRVYATIKFFLYTFLGSVFMLVALIYMYFQSGTMEILAFHDLKINLTEQVLIFVAFLLAFAVKVPMWPVHTWLPDAHVEAPLSGSASGEPEVITRLISERAEPGRGPGSWGGAAPIAGKKTDSGPIAPWSEPPAAGSTSPEWYTGKPLRWRDPAAAAGSGGRHYQAAVPHRGLLDPLPAEPTYIRPPGTPVQKPAFASPTPASGHHRSTQDLLALYLDYAPARLTADPAHPGQAKARSEAPPPAPESRRYFYRPTGTTFDFRALEPDPRAPVPAPRACRCSSSPSTSSTTTAARSGSTRLSPGSIHWRCMA